MNNITTDLARRRADFLRNVTGLPNACAVGLDGGVTVFVTGLPTVDGVPAPVLIGCAVAPTRDEARR